MAYHSLNRGRLLLILRIYRPEVSGFRFQVSGENVMTMMNPSLKVGPYPRIEVSGVRTYEGVRDNQVSAPPFNFPDT